MTDLEKTYLATVTAIFLLMVGALCGLHLGNRGRDQLRDECVRRGYMIYYHNTTTQKDSWEWVADREARIIDDVLQSARGRLENRAKP